MTYAWIWVPCFAVAAILFAAAWRARRIQRSGAVAERSERDRWIQVAADADTISWRIPTPRRAGTIYASTNVPAAAAVIAAGGRDTVRTEISRDDAEDLYEMGRTRRSSFKHLPPAVVGQLFRLGYEDWKRR